MSHTLAVTLLALPNMRSDGSSSAATPADTAAAQAKIAADANIAERIRNGDEKAFLELMDSYFIPIIRFANGFVKDRDVAQDIAQDVFARIWELHESWRPQTSVRAYLFSSARNRALNLLKHRSVEERGALLEIESTDDGQMAAEQSLDTSVVLSALRNAIAQLPERRRTALMLRYEAGMSHSEIGAALGVSPKAAKELLVRTIDVLRDELRNLK